MKPSFWPALFAIVTGTFMAILDTSIVNVALPKMMNVFGVSASEIQWVLTSYTLAMAAVIPLTGYLGDRFGMKRTYISAFILFTVGSLLCGLAWSNTSMIVARIIQAVGGGMLMPVGQALIYHEVPQEKMGPAMGVFGISAMVAPAVGPTLSGYIVEHLDWHFIFTLNVPIGIIGILLAWTFLRETPIRTDLRFDLPGFLYSALMLTTLLLAVAKGEEKGWTSFYIVSLLMASLICLLLFVYRALTIKQPILNIRLMAIPDFTLGMAVNCLMMIGMFGVVFLIPIYAENLLGYSAMKTGVLMLPQTLAQGFITFITSAILLNRMGGRKLILLGLIISSLSGLLLIHLNDQTSYSYIQLVLLLRGFGLGFCMMTSMQLPLQALTREQTGGATALLNVARQIATSVGVAILTSVYQTQGTKHAVHYAETVTADNLPTSTYLSVMQQQYVGAGLDSSQAYGQALASVAGLVRQYAAIQALDDAFLVSLLFLAAAIPITLLIKETKPATRKQDAPLAAEA